MNMAPSFKLPKYALCFQPISNYTWEMIPTSLCYTENLSKIAVPNAIATGEGGAAGDQYEEIEVRRWVGH